MKRTAIGLVLAVGVVAAISAQLDIRNISSVSVDANFDGSVGLDVNQVVLFDVTDWLKGEIKLQRQDTPVLHETTISVAPVFLSSSVTYLIVRYGLGIGSGAEASEALDADDQSRSFSHDLTVDANYESESLYANLAVRGSYYPSDDYWFVLPSVGAQFPFGEGVSVLSRYFFSYNSEQVVSNALLAELSYAVTTRFSVKGGATGSLELSSPSDTGNRESEWAVTGITGFSYRIRPPLTLRYHLEYLGRLGSADGVRNILVLDASF